MATSSSLVAAAAADAATADDKALQQAAPSKNHGENITSVARQISEGWQELRESLKLRQVTDGNFNEAGDVKIQEFNRLVSLLVQLTAEAKVPEVQTKPMMREDRPLLLQRFLEEQAEGQVLVEQDRPCAVPVVEVEAEPQNGKHPSVAAAVEKTASPSASSFSLVADSALSITVSDDTVVDMAAVRRRQKTRQQLDTATQRDLNEKLCRIVTSGHPTKDILEGATEVLDAGADVNARDDWCDGIVYDKLWKDFQSREGWLRATVLYAAVAARADCDIIRLLLDNGAEINRRGGFYGTPLQAIVRTDEKDMVRLLLNRGAEITAHPAHVGSVLRLATRYGTVGIVGLLLEHGALVTEADYHNETALHDAAHRGHLGIIKLLLDRGAVVDAQKKDSGATPLALAVRMGHEAAVQTLLMRGADVTLLPPVMRTYADWPERGRLMDMLKEYGVEYTCSAPEVPYQQVLRSVPTYELVHQGHATATFPEQTRVQQQMELTKNGYRYLGNGQPLPEHQGKDVERTASQKNDTNQPRQNEMEEVGSVMSFQTNSTTKTKTRKRGHFWSRFSSQTTLHDNS